MLLCEGRDPLNTDLRTHRVNSLKKGSYVRVWEYGCWSTLFDPRLQPRHWMVDSWQPRTPDVLPPGDDPGMRRKRRLQSFKTFHINKPLCGQRGCLSMQHGADCERNLQWLLKAVTKKHSSTAIRCCWFMFRWSQLLSCGFIYTLHCLYTALCSGAILSEKY